MTDKRNTFARVGYGKPPASGRFQKGQSGNRAGRPKGARNLATEYMEEVHATIPITENGKPRKISKLRATIKQQVAQGATGDQRAGERVIERVAAIEARLNENTRGALFTEADRQVINTIFERLIHQRGDENE